MTILETKRLLLRQFTLDDLDALVALYSDAEVKQYVYDEDMNAAQTREELEWAIQLYADEPGFGLWATIDKATGQFIGRCGLLQWTIDERLEVEVAYMFAKASWGQGLATEVTHALIAYGVEQLHLSRLICVIDADNVASIKVAENVGMSFEKIVDTGDGPERLYALNR